MLIISFEVCTIQAITENIMQFGHVRARCVTWLAETDGSELESVANEAGIFALFVTLMQGPL
jgi:hypothetical protein